MGEGTAAEPVGTEVAEADSPPRRPRRTLAVVVALAVAAVAALGGRLGWTAWREARERSRLRALILKDIAAREAAIPHPESVDPAQDAATTYAAAFVAVDRPALNRLNAALSRYVIWQYGVARRASRVPGGKRSPTAAKDLEVNAKALELFEKASEFPASSFRDPRKWRWGEMAGLFAARADALQDGGDPDGALRDLVRVHRAARQWQRPWPLRITPEAFHTRAVELLARVAEDRRLGAQAAREALAALLTAEECRRIGADRYALSRIDQARYLVEFVGDERRAALARRGIQQTSAIQRLFERLRGRSYWNTLRPPKSADVVRALEAKSRFEKIHAMKGAARVAAADQFHREMTQLPPNDLARDAAWNDIFQLADATESEMFLGLVRTALAVRVREAETGAPPARLEELVPGVLDALPEDPYSGKPYFYVVKPGGWSVSASAAPSGWPSRSAPTRIDSLPAATPVERK